MSVAARLRKLEAQRRGYRGGATYKVTKDGQTVEGSYRQNPSDWQIVRDWWPVLADLAEAAERLERMDSVPVTDTAARAATWEQFRAALARVAAQLDEDGG